MCLLEVQTVLLGFHNPHKPLHVPRTLIHGDKKAGFSVFWADDGLDTGPILLQRECAVEPNDTVDTLYNRFLFPEGIKAMVTKWNFSRTLFMNFYRDIYYKLWLLVFKVEAVQLIADGKAPRIPQKEEGASYEGIQKKSNSRVRRLMQNRGFISAVGQTVQLRLKINSITHL